MRICRRCGGFMCLYWLCRADVLALLAAVVGLVVGESGDTTVRCYAAATTDGPIITICSEPA